MSQRAHAYENEQFKETKNIFKFIHDQTKFLRVPL